MKFVKIADQIFEMQTTQVTQNQWKKIMGTNPSHFKGKNNPVDSVSWNECQEFIEKLNKKEKKYNYRLSTEQEWELCAKSCDDQKIEGISWCWENSDKKTHPVGKKKPNKIGLYDMLGNVWEWTNSSEGSLRVFRGGSWYYDAQYLRSASRSYYSPGNRNFNFGFRLLRTPKPRPSKTFTLEYKALRALEAAKKALKEIEEILK